MLARVVSSGSLADLGSMWRGLATQASSVGTRPMSTNTTNNSNGDRPLSADPGVRQARRQQPNSLHEPPLLHDSMSEIDYSYYNARRAASLGPRVSSISDPQDYYLNNSLSEGTYGLPSALQRGPKRTGQGFASAGPATRPTMQRIFPLRSAAQDAPERLHDSFGHMEYPCK